MSIYAYIRVSTDDQTTDNQKLQIEKQGFAVDEWYSDNGVSGKIPAMQRPNFVTMMGNVKEGDTICVVTLDRLGRNTEDILSTIRMCSEKGVKLRVMALDGTDLTSKSGKILVVLMSLIAELERDDIVTRTKAGLERTKKEGTLLGRPLSIPPEVFEELVIGRSIGVTLDSLSAKYSIDRNTIRQAVLKWGKDLPAYRARWNKQVAQSIKKAQS